MYKDRCFLLRLLFILFVMSATSIVFSQNSFSQTDTVEIIKEINASEDKLREHFDKNITQLDTNTDKNFKDLTDKIIDLNTGVAVNKTEIGSLKDQFKSLLNAIYTFIILFILYIIGQFTKPKWQQWFKLTKSTGRETKTPQELDNQKPTFTDPTLPETDYPQGTGHEQPH